MINKSLARVLLLATSLRSLTVTAHASSWTANDISHSFFDPASNERALATYLLHGASFSNRVQYRLGRRAIMQESLNKDFSPKLHLEPTEHNPIGAMLPKALRRRRPTIGTPELGTHIKLTLRTVAIASMLLGASGPAVAAAQAGAAGEKLHVGQKLALALQGSTSLPPAIVLMIISALPVVELRGGIPVGIWMGLPVGKTLALCITGNMVPVLPILLALRSEAIRKFAAPLLRRAQSKAESFGNPDDRLRALALFVGIPLPGTGAWTGAMVASLLAMPLGASFAAIGSGVVLASAIMTAATKAGLKGAVALTLAAALGVLVSREGNDKK